MMWSELDKGARLGLVFGMVILIALTVGLFMWVFKSNQEALFDNLDSTEAANIVTALEEMKVPYTMANNGSTIMVDEAQAQKVRVKLIGQGVPMHAGNGFELFDNADIGMTEYSQKINYLRALQGELARSIMSIDGIKYARVHLVLPEASIFRQKKQSSTASVTVIPEQGTVLSRDQILGVQRLIASSTPGIAEEDVTVIDNNGVTLSSVNPAINRDNVTTLILQKKTEAERYLESKIHVILDKSFGVGNSIATVSVDLVVDKVHRKEETVLPRSSKDAGVLRKRESITGGNGDRKDSGTKTVEMEYQLSKRIEEIVSMPGAIERINVGVMVPEETSPEQVAHLREIVSMSVGLNLSRGDELAIYPMKIDVISGVIGKKDLNSVMTRPSESATPDIIESDSEIVLGPLEDRRSVVYLIAGLSVALMLLLGLLLYSVAARKRATGKRLTSDERDKLLGDIKKWLNNGEVA